MLGFALGLALTQLAHAYPDEYSLSLHLPEQEPERPVGARQILRMAAVSGEHGRSFLLRTEYPPGCGLVGKAFVDVERRVLVASGDQIDRSLREDGDDYHHLFPGTNSNIAIPLVFHDEVLGVLNVEHPKADVFRLKPGRHYSLVSLKASVYSSRRLFVSP